MHTFDALTAEHMAAAGTWKWSTAGSWRGRPWIGAFVAEMDYPVAGPVAGAVRASADASQLGYLADAWTAEAAGACAGFWADRFGWPVDPARVRPVPDVLTALVATIRHFTPPGSAVVLPTPGYMPFLRVPGMLGRELVEVPMAGGGGSDAGGRPVLDLEVIDRALAGGAGLLVLINPHNPTGRVLDDAELAAVTEVVERHGARVFADEVHAPLALPGAAHRPYAASSPAAAAHTVTATSASKAWNTPGLKAAQVILSSAADVARWDGTAYLAEHSTATPGVRAAAAAYRDGRGWLDDVLGYLDGLRDRLAAAELPGVTVHVPEGTYLAWLDARELAATLDAESPAAFLRRESGVVLTDGALCGAAGRDHLRMTFAVSRPTLDEALERMHAALVRR